MEPELKKTEVERKSAVESYQIKKDMKEDLFQKNIDQQLLRMNERLKNRRSKSMLAKSKKAEREKSLLQLKQIGNRNRNLKTFKVDLENSINICNQIPENFTKISESGLNSIDDIRILLECGFDGFLIGEQFMREKDPGSKLKELINSY